MSRAEARDRRLVGRDQVRATRRRSAITIPLEPGSTILFTGDSVTDCGRRQDAPAHLGFGYVRGVAESPRVAGATIVNTGTSGNRIVDLEQRWRADVLDHHADVVSVLIGINDTWRRYDSRDETSAATFEGAYSRMLESVAAGGSRLVLIEPFLLPLSKAQQAWRDDLDPKIEIVRRLAVAYNAILVPADREMTRQASELGAAGLGSAQLGAAALAEDGVHPTELGHERLAELWLDTVVGPSTRRRAAAPT